MSTIPDPDPALHAWIESVGKRMAALRERLAAAEQERDVALLTLKIKLESGRGLASCEAEAREQITQERKGA